GNLGSGKSSISKILMKKGYEIISTGTIFRELAMEQNMSVEDFNQKVHEDSQKGDHSVDDLIDKRTTRMNEEKDNVVFDSRLAWNFAKGSFKVFVIVDIREAARRVYNDSLRKETEDYETEEKCRLGLMNRQQIEMHRFKEIYGIDYFDMSNYNLIIESTNTTPEAIVEQILLLFEAYKKGEFKRLVKLNPSSIYPTKSIALCDKEERQDKEPLTVTMDCGMFYGIENQGVLLDAYKKKEDFITVQVSPLQKVEYLSQGEYEEFEEKTGISYACYPNAEVLEDLSLLMF
ncbi:AAA family ATPase, partial [Lachnospiraceae bacterium OttesenSCG-928-D06]|nr:AAA family ATPase [Lachnospiraceae bacterium OttesenSCG-928-D06]